MRASLRRRNVGKDPRTAGFGGHLSWGRILTGRGGITALNALAVGVVARLPAIVALPAQWVLIVVMLCLLVVFRGLELMLYILFYISVLALMILKVTTMASRLIPEPWLMYCWMILTVGMAASMVCMPWCAFGQVPFVDHLRHLFIKATT